MQMSGSPNPCSFYAVTALVSFPAFTYIFSLLQQTQFKNDRLNVLRLKTSLLNSWELSKKGIHTIFSIQSSSTEFSLCGITWSSDVKASYNGPLL